MKSLRIDPLPIVNRCGLASSLIDDRLRMSRLQARQHVVERLSLLEAVARTSVASQGIPSPDCDGSISSRSKVKLCQQKIGRLFNGGSSEVKSEKIDREVFYSPYLEMRKNPNRFVMGEGGPDPGSGTPPGGSGPPPRPQRPAIIVG